MTPQSSKKSNDKKKQSSTNLNRASGQFIHFADRLAGAINGSIGQSADVSMAMNEANGYNIVSSKSQKMLPLYKDAK